MEKKLEGESLLNSLEILYQQAMNLDYKEILALYVNKEVLNNIAQEIKNNTPWSIKSKEQLIEEGLRYRGIIFKIDKTLDDDKIIFEMK